MIAWISVKIAGGSADAEASVRMAATVKIGASRNWRSA